MIDQLVAALGRELGLTSKEIADTVWLALQMESPELSSTAKKATDGETDAKLNRDKSVNLEALNTEESPQEGQPAAELHTPSSQFENGGGLGSELMLKVPNARSLREPLSLAKSLKPLLQKVTAGWSTKLDEAATVERIADEGIWVPVLQPALEPWLDLALVVDESISMHLWQRTLTELQRVLSNYGVFRDVRVWSLVTDDDGQVKLRPRLGAAARRQTLHRPSELIDAGGRRLILIATDCVSAIWQDGTVFPALKLWAASGPMAIVQMLPEWLWARTRLGFASAVRLHALMPGVPNRQLDMRDLSPWDEVDMETGVRMPVVTLEPEPFSAWTKMVSAKENAWVPGFIFEPKAVTSTDPIQLWGTSSEDSAEQRVQRFRSTASPVARRLAILLAAAPVISLPVVRIIRNRHLPYSRQIHTAEVLLGGLLSPLQNTNDEMILDSESVEYDFLDGVREVLLSSLPTEDSINVLEEVSSFIAEKLGLSLNTFLVLLMDPEASNRRGLTFQQRPFAKITSQVLMKLGGEYARFAEELLQYNQIISEEENITNSTYSDEVSFSSEDILLDSRANMQDPTSELSNYSSSLVPEDSSDNQSDKIFSNEEINQGFSTNSSTGRNNSDQLAAKEAEISESYDEYDDLWNQVLSDLKAELSRPTFETWIKPCRVLSFSDQNLVIETPNPFAQKWLKKHYSNTISKIVENILGHKLAITITAASQEVVDTEIPENSQPEESSQSSERDEIEKYISERKEDLKIKLNQKLTFERFVVSASNRFAHAAALAVAESPGKEFNPLFLCSGNGLGKTHLMQAIGHHHLAKTPDSFVVYISTEQFTNDLISAIRKDHMQKFRSLYRSADILLIDDIQFIEGKEYTQEEFFHTFNTLVSLDRQIVLASDRPPRQMPRVQERLVTRFSSGLIVDISPPDLSTRIEILKHKAKYDHDIDLSDEITKYIAEKYDESIPEMEGALLKILAHKSLLDWSLTVESVAQILRQDE